jgi:hypothetical protein
MPLLGNRNVGLRAHRSANSLLNSTQLGGANPSGEPLIKDTPQSLELRTDLIQKGILCGVPVSAVQISVSLEKSA